MEKQAKDYKILIACEFSGIVRTAFRERGFNAWSCDLLPTEDKSEFHYEQDVLCLLNEKWDMMIAHPPCTYLCNSGVHWLHRQEGRWEKMEEGSIFFRNLWKAKIPYIAVENPVMHKYAKEIIGVNYNQTVQPFQFGHSESKRTALWLKGLPELKPTKIMKPTKQGENGKFYWDNQTPSGQNKLAPSSDRWKERSRTYKGFADAMAIQWGDFLLQQGCK